MTAFSVDQFWDEFESFLNRTLKESLEIQGMDVIPYPLPAGATEEELTATEKEFGYPLPEDLKSFYRRHNGSSFWPRAEYFNSLQEGLGKAQMRTDIVRSNLQEGENTLNSSWWREYWFPIVEDGGGNADAVQCGGDTAGLMASFDHETGGEGLDGSFLDFLQATLTDLGFYVVDAEGELMPRNELPEDHPEYFDGDIYDWYDGSEAREE